MLNIGIMEREDDLPEDKKWYEEVNGLEYNSKTDRYRVPDYIKITFRLKEEDIDPKTITIAIKRIGLAASKKSLCNGTKQS